MSAQAVIFASFHPKPDGEGQFRDLIAEMIKNTRDEPGCLVYDFFTDGIGGFHLFEVYRDDAALEAHRAADYYKSYRAAVVDHLERPIDVLELSVIDRAAHQ